MYFHWQNLNEKPNKKNGSGFWNGRCWLRISERKEISLQWVFGRTHAKSFGVSVRCDTEGWHPSIRIYGLIGLYFGFNVGLPLPRKLSHNKEFYLTDEREFELSIHDWTIWFKPWGRTMEWASADPWYVRGLIFHVDNFFLGKNKHSEELVEEKDVLIPMPEGSYPAKVKLMWETWKRPRWFAKRIMRAHIECPAGIPHEGKGENSWDCGEDATYGITCTARTIEEGIGKLVQSVLRDRRKYGTPSRLQPHFAVTVKEAV